MEKNSSKTNQLDNRISENKFDERDFLWLNEGANNQITNAPYYGDVTELNTERTILDLAGKETLAVIVSDLMDLLETSVAIYEKNGDYAFGMFNSGWCQLMDSASRKLCNTDDNKTALNCGKWICHEDCWNNSAKAAIESKKSTDIDCIGKIKLYAEPIFVNDEVIGTINIGYGNPPKDEVVLQKLAYDYNIDFELLKTKANEYNPRPNFIIEIAKKRLKSCAKLIGEIVTRKKVEQAFKESEYLHREVLSNISDAVFLTDEENNFTFVCPNVHYIFGFKKEEVIKLQKITNLIPELHNIDKIELNKRNEIKNIECTVYDKYKQQHTLLIHIKKVNIRKKEILYSCRDITEKVKTEQALKESEEKHRMLIENLGEGIGSVDENEKFIFANREAEMIFGLEPGKLIGKNVKDFISEKNYNYIKEETFKRKEGQKSTYELEIINLKGEKVDLLITATPEFDIDGNFKSTFAIFRDITEQRLTEQALKESEKKFRAIFEQAGIGVALVNTKTGKFVRINQQYCDFIGYTKQEILQKTFMDITHPEDVQPNINSTLNMISGELNILTYDKRYIRKDGNIAWGRLTISPLWKTGEKPETYFHVAIVEDITERKQTEQALKESEEKLKISNADKDRFMQILAHDLKNPFSSLLGFSDLLIKNLHKYDIEKIEHQLKIIHQTTRKTYSLLEDLLLWSKSQSGKLTINPLNIVFGDICNDIINNLKNQSNPKGITIQCFEAERTFLTVDLNMFKTILRNLISNAIKFTNKNGQIRIFSERDNENVKITISDNGVGIEKENIPKLWDFTQPFSTKGTSDEKGTGFGLLVCKEFVEQHGGKIWVESEIGKGSDFIFTIPFSNDKL
ncbi:MAG: PAS domain S-box protein [Bacteroidales bacterium]|nr:PAS domain S-box protein [Bacteroidales bacterium]